MNDAYQYLRGRANLDDPDELVRLARWCHEHGLKEKALENAASAVKLDPRHAEARHILTGLQRAAAPHAAPAPAAEESEPPEAPDLNSASRAACAGCHTGPRGGKFRLARSYAESSAGRRSLQQNLAAVMEQVNLTQPQESKLLAKAITAHDPQARQAQAPLDSKKQLAAYRTLEDWVMTTVATNPHLRERAPPTPPATTSVTLPAQPKPATTPEATPAKPAATVAKAAEATPAPTATFADGGRSREPSGTHPTPEPPHTPAPAPPSPAPSGGFAAGRPAPTPPAGPVDPFDPILFNGEGQPDNGKP
jgi:hypothetical protein